MTINLLGGVSYYRLKQTDYDGKFEYFELKAVNFDGVVSPHFSVYPNPSNGSNLTIKIGKQFGANLDITISNLSGKLLYRDRFVNSSLGENNQLIRLKTLLNKEVFILKIKYEKGLVKTEKLIVQ